MYINIYNFQKVCQKTKCRIRDIVNWSDKNIINEEEKYLEKQKIFQFWSSLCLIYECLWMLILACHETLPIDRQNREIYEVFNNPVALRLNQWLKLYWQGIRKVIKLKKKQHILCNISIIMSIIIIITMHWYRIWILRFSNFCKDLIVFYWENKSNKLKF